MSDDETTKPDNRSPLEMIRDDMVAIRTAAERAADAAVETLQGLHDLRNVVHTLSGDIAKLKDRVDFLERRIEMIEQGRV